MKTLAHCIGVSYIPDSLSISSSSVKVCKEFNDATLVVVENALSNWLIRHASQYMVFCVLFRDKGLTAEVPSTRESYPGRVHDGLSEEREGMNETGSSGLPVRW